MRTRFLHAAAAAVILGGCATSPSRGDSYEQALAQWQGASEELLLQRWGKPQSQEQAGSARWLTYVARNGSVPAPTVGLSIGGFGFGGGGHSAVGVGVGAAVPVGAPTPITCTTRFLVENGKVSTWTFDGPGCGA